MQNIFIIGAGRSSSSLINYLIKESSLNNWNLTVGDVSLDAVLQKTGHAPETRAIAFNIEDDEQRKEEISKADIVISMLPAFMHYKVAVDCVALKKHLVTASYVSPEIAALNDEAVNAGIVLMNEIGLDPGIDHMSAMQVIDEIKEKGGRLNCFKSFCGGLVAPESNDNPWGYKFSWNPRNVILAGQSTAKYLEDGQLKYIPYNRLFKMTEKISVDGYGKFDAYANRDSLSYREPYGIQETATLLRGTLRYPGYCKAWDAFVQLGVTDDTYIVEYSESLTYRKWIEAYLPTGEGDIKERLAAFLKKKADGKTMQKLEWLGILEDEVIGIKDATPARILQHLLERKWLLKPEDKDMVVMQHIFDYTINDTEERRTSSLVVIGEDNIHTAMAKTVGLPVAIITKLIMLGKVKLSGVHIPTSKAVYEPVLNELNQLGIVFTEKVIKN